MNNAMGRDAAIGYNPKDFFNVYFNSNGNLGIIEIKTIGIAIGILSILSAAFLPFPLGLLGVAAGVGVIFFSVTRIGDLKSLNEFQKINHQKNVAENGVCKGAYKTTVEILNTGLKVVNEAGQHTDKVWSLLSGNIRWKKFRNIF